MTAARTRYNYSVTAACLLAVVVCSSTCQGFVHPGSQRFNERFLSGRPTFSSSSIQLQPNDRVIITSGVDDDDDDDGDDGIDVTSMSEASFDPSYESYYATRDPETSSLLTLAQPDLKRKKMELIMCNRDLCTDIIRERVWGDDNHMKFDGPATGQVCYVWDDDDENWATRRQSVLVLVRPGDDKLLALAADAVQHLVQQGIQVYLAPDLAAKLKHYHGVEDRNNLIQLYEPLAHPGFGGSHVDANDELMGEVKTKGSVPSQNPDLICTLGGDGLLMHASMMFAGPVPPILCVAGGSLGFLTPFSREEMVDAICIALGVMKQQEHHEQERRSLDEIRPFMLQEKQPQFQLGSGSRICLSMRMRLDCRVINREGVVRARFNVLNEVVIDRGNSPYLAALECFCDDVHLTTVQADGIIFAT